MSESESDHGVGGFADPTAQQKNKRPWVKPVLTCETAQRTSSPSKLHGSFELATGTSSLVHKSYGPS